MRSLRFQAPLLALIKDLDGGTVSWSRQGRARIRYRLGGAAVGTARRALVELSRLGRAAGATELMTVATPTDRISLAEVSDATWHAFLARQASADLRPNRTSLFSAHQMGTARAGAEPSGHPCDPSGRVRRDVRGTLVSGLYVADSSLFPTASGVNPMLTVMTLAERTARAVLGD
jgi:long-chain-alcohol oxidase